jgi:hypothetical protein
VTSIASDNVDRQSCADALDALLRLEGNSRRRNEALRDMDRAIARQRTVITTLAALIIPLVIWAFFAVAEAGATHASSFGSGFHDTMMRAFSLIAVTVFIFLIGFFGLGRLWRSRVMAGLRGLAEQSARKRYFQERDRVDDSTRAILSEPVFIAGLIPEEFLSVQMVTLLLRYFDSGQATFMDAAVYMLKAELQHNKHYGGFGVTATIVDKERELLASDAAARVVEMRARVGDVAGVDNDALRGAS